MSLWLWLAVLCSREFKPWLLKAVSILADTCSESFAVALNPKFIFRKRFILLIFENFITVKYSLFLFRSGNTQQLHLAPARNFSVLIGELCRACSGRLEKPSSGFRSTRTCDDEVFAVILLSRHSVVYRAT
jgi:hypothetical protein